MKNSFTVKTILRKDLFKKDEPNKHPLHYQIIFRGGKTKTTSGKYVHINDWDDKKKCVKENLLKTILQKEESRIYNLLLEMENNGETFNKENILKKINRKENIQQNQDFYFHFDEYLKNKFAIEDLSEGTKYHYTLLRKRLKQFKPNLTLREINAKLIDDFVYFLKVDKQVGKSGINSRVKNLNCVLKKFVTQKIIEENPCIHYKKFEEQSSIVFLNKEELERFRSVNLDIDTIPKSLKYTRDLFLFSCYTGLRDCDVKTLRKKDITKGKSIVKRQIKTKDVVEIPFNEYWYSILMKYDINNKKDEDLLLTSTSNALINRHLKVIAKLSKIKKKVSFHTARHTFGSLLALEGTPINCIAKLMGHRNIKTTHIYMNTDSKTLSNVMKDIKF